MKPKNVFFILMILMIIPAYLCAQSQQDYFKDQKLEIPDGEYYISRVIDCRYELTDLEQRRKNIFASKITFEKNLDQSILSLFRSAIDDTIGKIPVTLKINWFAYEKVGYKLFIGANFDFYTHEDGLIYYQFMAGNHRDSNNEYYYSSIIKEDACAIIEQSYIEFLHRMKNKLGYHKEVQENAVLHNSLINQTPQTFFSSKPRNGIFYSFNNFRDNLADTLTKFTSKASGSESRTFNIKSDHDQNYWAIVYENDLYYNREGIAVPMFEGNNAYRVKDKIKHKLSGSTIQGASVGVIIYLVAGTMIFASSGAILTPLAGILISGIGAGIGALIPKYETLDVNLQIDLFTGKEIPIREFYNQKPFRPGKRNGELTFYFPQKAHDKIEISINEAKPSYFESFSYFNYQKPQDINKIRFCLKSSSDEFCDSIVMTSYRNLSFDVLLKKNGTIKCKAITNENTIEKYNRWIGRGILEK